jgi:hypothetical protein
MGWANCGSDSRGRPIGYAHEATCDEPGCTESIDRGLAYACGGMHGEMPGCEDYFCPKHLLTPDLYDDEWEWAEKNTEWDGEQMCAACCRLLGAHVRENFVSEDAA